MEVIPALAGSPKVGEILRVDLSKWTGFPAPRFSVAWFVCDPTTSELSSLSASLPVGCVANETETSSALSSVSSDALLLLNSHLGKRIIAKVTSTNLLEEVSVYTPGSQEVLGDPVVVDPPTISGTRSTGNELTLSDGVWAAYPEPTTSHQWFRCTSAIPAATTIEPSQCSSIAGATSSTYSQTATDAGRFITARTTKVNTAGTTSIWSVATEATSQIPTPVSNPTISGTATRGATLTANPGSWQGFPTPSISYQWFLCDSQVFDPSSSLSNDCYEIRDATSQVRSLTEFEIGSFALVKVTASNTQSTVVQYSASTLGVSGPPNPGAPPTISGTRSTGNELTLSDGVWAAYPEPTTSHQWFRCTSAIPAATTIEPSQCSSIAGATSSTYSQTATDAGRFITARTTKVNTAGTTSIWSVATEATSQIPTPVSNPTISGTATQGATLTVNPGSWQGFPTPSISYQWFRCDSIRESASATEGAGCTAISGSSAGTRVLDSNDIGKHMVARVTANNAGGSTVRFTASTAQVSSAPTPTSNPAVSGTRMVGEILTVSEGIWTASPTPSTAHQWFRCNSQIATPTASLPTQCETISGATSSTYSQSSADAGRFITVRTTKTNTIGSYSIVASVPTSTSQIPTMAATPSISGTASLGSTFGIDRGDWQGFPAPRFSYQWFACSNEVSEESLTLPDGCTETGGLLGDMISVDTGRQFTCALVSNSTVQCWGLGSSGQLGNGSSTSSSTPVMVSGITTATSVSTGDQHACATLSSGSIQCWGLGTSGQLGNGSSVSSLIPVTVTGISNATSVSAGGFHTCATLASGGIRCWGASQRLGDGSTTNRSSPVNVSSISNAVSVSAGDSHSCATLSTGQIRCWGVGSAGQLGNGSTSFAATPVTVSGISSASSVVAESNATCAILQDGTVRCWGFVGWSGGGTSGTYAYRTTPATVTGIANATSVSVGPFTTRCATLTDGTVKCWRGGGPGLLPSGVSITQTTPSTVSGIESATSVSSRSGFSTGGHSCATTSKGRIGCWGNGDSGEIGNGATGWTGIPQEVIPPNYIRSIPADLVGKHLLVRVTALNGLGATSSFSRSSQVITAIPTASVNPLVSGTRANGQVLTVSDGTWIASPSEMTTSHLWFRCTSAVATATSTLPSQCSSISGATSATYTQTPDDAGKFITARTTRTNTIGSTNIWSAVTTASTAAPTLIVAPAVSGSVAFGSTLTTSSGTWQGFPIPTYSYQWFVCTSQVLSAATTIDVPTGCSEISPSTATTQTLVSNSLIGKYLLARVDAINSFGRTTVFTASTAIITSAPVATYNPTVSGTRGNGQVLTVSEGTWIASPSEMTTSQQWFRCTSAVTTATALEPSQCSTISGATSATYTQTPDDAGKFVTARTTRTNSIGSTNLFSVATTASTSEPVSVSAPIVSGSAIYGSNLAVSKGEWQGFPEPGFNYQWFVCDNEVLQAGSSRPENCTETAFASGEMTEISQSEGHTCALLADRSVQCWGSNAVGQLGNGSTTSSPTPVNVVGISTAVAIAAGGDHTCALLENNTVQCWGHGRFGQLGTGNTSSSTTPVQVAGLFPAIAIAAGLHSTCAILEGGSVKCWGTGPITGSSTGTTSSFPVSVSGISTATSISSSENHTCVILENGEVSCWGGNNVGQLGNRSNADSTVPQAVFGVSGASSIATGRLHSCASLVTGEVKCWGDNEYNKLGRTTSLRAYQDSGLVAGVGSVHSVVAGDNHTCALITDGAVTCWGRNSFGQLSGGISNAGFSPRFVPQNSPTMFVSAGDNNTCAIRENGYTYCWGAGYLGQLGSGGAVDTGTPQQVLPSNVIFINQEQYLGKYLLARVVGTNSVKVPIYTRSTTAITLVPTYSAPPQVSGARSNGSALTVSTGTWSSFPAISSTSYQWYRCLVAVPTALQTLPPSCVEISGATSSSYSQQLADSTYFITTRTTRSNSVGSTNVWSTVLVATN